jgi:cyclopropane-fatty-acyl-phospholipid synthase
VFPDGQLHEVGTVITALQDGGLEVRHMENLREHYALTLRNWVGNLETNWDAAVAEVGVGRARVWRLYMAASAVMFESDEVHVDQILAVKPVRTGSSELPLRPDWEPASETPPGPDGRRRLRTHRVSARLEARAMNDAELADD